MMASFPKLFLILLFFLPNLYLEAKDPATCSLYSMESEDKSNLYKKLHGRAKSKIILFFKEKGGLDLSNLDFDISIRNHIEVGPGRTTGYYYNGIYKLTDLNFKFNSPDGDKFRSFLDDCDDQIDHYCHFGRNELIFRDQIERDWRGKATSRKCIISGINGIKMGIVNISQQNYHLGDVIIFEAGEEIMSFPLDFPTHSSVDENDLP